MRLLALTIGRQAQNQMEDHAQHHTALSSTYGCMSLVRLSLTSFPSTQASSVKPPGYNVHSCINILTQQSSLKNHPELTWDLAGIGIGGRHPAPEQTPCRRRAHRQSSKPSQRIYNVALPHLPDTPIRSHRADELPNTPPQPYTCHQRAQILVHGASQHVEKPTGKGMRRQRLTARRPGVSASS